tara:strand:+ start:949 stop:1620 length:672 start_codon:yes stop_codon:yes gene_type:complete
MKSEKVAIKRLTKIQSEVSTHYFVKKNGDILRMVPDLHIAWHAGISQWGKYKLLNKNSIGIEISNTGHQHGYESFSKRQLKSIIKLTKILIKKYKINKNNILGHSDVAPERKKDPGEKFPWKLLYKNQIGIWHNLNYNKLFLLRKKKVSLNQKKIFIINLKKIGYSFKSKIIKKVNKYESLLIKAFQRRFRPEIINGQIDQECFVISNKLRLLAHKNYLKLKI